MKMEDPLTRGSRHGCKTGMRATLIAVALCASSAFAGNFYAGISPANVPWPGGIVPYEFTNTPTMTALTNTYLDGLREWELAANVKFVPHTNQTRWILFDYNTNFLDFVASGYSPQLISVSSLSRAQVCHEMGHSFGFTHENIRFDQTNHLTVVTNNISNEASNIFWFTIDPTSVTNGYYDFESVMHLGWDFVSTQPGVLPTQQPKPAYSPRYQYRMQNYCISPGDRAALAYLYGPPAVPLTNIVTTTSDVGPGSLRAAMYYVTDHPGTTVKFNIPNSDPGYSNGVFNIHLTGYLPPLVTNGMVIDGSTQPGFTSKPLIVVDGSQIIPQTFTPTSGLLIYSASNQVKNVSFQGFSWNGLTLEFADATNNTIAGCWLGLDSSGSNAAPNAYQGILIQLGASHNTIGGTNALARNVISGNSQYGLWISDTNTTGNVVLGNYIGTDATGSFAVSNAVGGIGMFTNSAGQIIGGTNALARNVISGNVSAGIWLSGAGVSNNVVENNFVGLNAAGNAAIANSVVGIYVVNGARSNTILNNVLSGNASEGLRLSYPGTAANLVQGNFIGTDATGTTSVPNRLLGLSIYTGATNNTVGGTSGGARNVISGNASEGLRIQGLGASWNLVEGNFIGTDVSGTNAVPNGLLGLSIYTGATSNTIGGTSGTARNVISGNASEGLRLSDPGTSANLVQGNYIGTDASGTRALPNGWTGLTIFSGAASNTIGGTSPAARNILSGNSSYGIVVSDSGTSENLIQGNYIGLATNGTAPLPNYTGVLITSSATNNTLGGASAAARNIVSGNNGSGLEIAYSAAANYIQGNFIGTDPTGVNAIANGGEGIYMHDGASGNFIGGPAAGAGNVISANTYRGIYAYGTSTSYNLIQGNFIGTTASGATALGNGWDGVVFFDGASSNVVGLSPSGTGTGNTIAFNGFTGVYVGSDNTNLSIGETIRGNTIYSNNYIGINLAGGTEDAYGVTANHLGGAVPGPNHLQNYPIITNAVANGTSTMISGTLNSSASRSFLIDVYRNPAPDPSGHGQGQVYAGSATVLSDAGGNARFSVTASGNFSGQYFSATATDQTSGDTSEFSADVVATNGPSAPEFVGPYGMTATGFTAVISLTLGQSYHIQAATNLTAPITWTNLTSFTAAGSLFQFVDPSATNYRARFYRVVSP
jgi:titin